MSGDLQIGRSVATRGIRERTVSGKLTNMVLTKRTASAGDKVCRASCRKTPDTAANEQTEITERGGQRQTVWRYAEKSPHLPHFRIPDQVPLAVNPAQDSRVSPSCIFPGDTLFLDSYAVPFVCCSHCPNAPWPQSLETWHSPGSSLTPTSLQVLYICIMVSPDE